MRRQNQRRGEHGYVMLALLLMLALLIIAAAVIVPSITFEIRRDQEEEMIHRGVQYSRAIKAYYKKFNRYPMKIEDLENSNRQRFLRKRYKDPITKQDFKLLHFGEVKLALTGGIGGGTIPGANSVGPNGSLTPASGLNDTSGVGGNSAFGGNSNSAFGQNQQAAPQPGTDPSQPGSTDASGGNAPGQGNDTSTSGDKLATTTFGGAPIVGVASTSKKDTIREYDHKKKYDQWKFIYDPTMDVAGRLITTPYQPQLAGFGMQGSQNLNGQNGSSSQPANGFGNSNGFGSSGFGNSPTAPSNGGFGQQNPPSNPPQQQ